MKKRILSLLLVIMTLVTMIPINNVFADEVLTEANKFQEEVKTVNTELNVMIENTIYKDAITNLPNDILEWDIKEPANVAIRGNQEAIVNVVFKDGSVKDIIVPVTVGENIPNVFRANSDGSNPDEVPDYYVKVTVDPENDYLRKFNTMEYFVNPYVTVEIPYIKDVYRRGTSYVRHKEHRNGINDTYFEEPDPKHESFTFAFFDGQHNFYFDKSLVGKFKDDTLIKAKYMTSKGLAINYKDTFTIDDFNDLIIPDEGSIISLDEYIRNAELIHPMPRMGFPLEEVEPGIFRLQQTTDNGEDVKYLPGDSFGSLITIHSFVNTPGIKNHPVHFFHQMGIQFVADIMPDNTGSMFGFHYPKYYKAVTVNIGGNGTIDEKSCLKFWVTPKRDVDLTELMPKVTANQGYNFDGWDKDLKTTFTEDTVISAKYSKTPFDKNNIVKMKIVNEPSKMAYIEGNELDLTGLQVKLTDKDGIEKVIELNDLAEYGITTEPANKTKLTVKDNDKTIVVNKEGLDNVETQSKLSVTNAIFTPNKPALTEVKNIDKITEEEKTKVEEEIIKANPDIKTEEITVNDNGSVIIKHDGKIGTLKPEETIVKKSEDKKDNEKYPVVKPKKTEVKDINKLTKEEKDQVEKEVKKVNPNAKTIEVDDNGDTVITYPDNSTNELKQKDTVIEKKPEDTRKDNEKYPIVKPEKTGVEDINDLTYAEKDEVKEAIRKANPHAKTIEVKDNGDAIIIYPDGSVNKLKQEDTVYKNKESHKPYVDRVHEDDEYITGKGEPDSYIEIMLPNKKVLKGRTDKKGEFKIECPYRLYKDDVIEVVQYEFLHNASKPTIVRVEGPKDPKDKLIKDEHSAYIVGYPNGQFRPNNTITRAEAAAMLARLSKNQTVRRTMNFSDVRYGDWFYNAVNIGVSEGFIKGYFDGKFRPNEPITRAEFAAAISTYADNAESEHKFKDVKGWSAGYVDTAYANGWMKGYDRNTFRPNNYLTRAEAVATINRMLNRRPDKKFIDKELLTYTTRNKFFSDVNGRDWFFYDVYEATWGHDYEAKKDVETWTKITGKIFILK